MADPWQQYYQLYPWLEANNQGWSTYDTSLERLLNQQPGRWRRTREGGDAGPSWIEWQNPQGQWIRRAGGGGEYNPFYLAAHNMSGWNDPTNLLFQSGLIKLSDVEAYRAALSGAGPPSTMVPAQQVQVPSSDLSAGPSMRSALTAQLGAAAPVQKPKSLGFLSYLRSGGGY
jgi:hypothetical protein